MCPAEVTIILLYRASVIPLRGKSEMQQEVL